MSVCWLGAPAHGVMTLGGQYRGDSHSGMDMWREWSGQMQQLLCVHGSGSMCVSCARGAPSAKLAHPAPGRTLSDGCLSLPALHSPWLLPVAFCLSLTALTAAAATSSTPFTPWGKPGVVKDSTRSVFVRNLPFEATYEDVASFFSQAGEVSVVAESRVL